MRALVLVVSLASLLVGACQAESPLPGREARRAELENRDFISSRVEFQGEPVVLVPGPQFGTATLVLRFNTTRIGATGGCNWYGAEGWGIDNGRLVVPEEFEGTLIGCPPSTDSQDRWLVDFLRSGPHVRIDGERVVMAVDDNVVTFLETDVEELAQP